MRKVAAFITILILVTSQINAQDTITISDDLDGWDYSWVAALNGSQASYSNWSQGGVDNISALFNSNFSAQYREGQAAYGFQLTTRYGKSRIEDQGTRKTDDRLGIRNRFLYDLFEPQSNYSIFANVNFRTQFDEGFEYGAGPDGGDVLISSFMAPAYFSQSAGLAYTPSDYFTFEGGLAMKQTIVNDEELRPIYGLDTDESFRNEAGVALGLNYEQELTSTILFSTSVETFTNLARAVDRTDVYYTGQLTGKITDVINTSLRVDLAYDDDFSDEWQVQQVLSVGVSFVLM